MTAERLRRFREYLRPNSDSGPSSITIDFGDLEGSGVATVNVSGVGGAGGNGLLAVTAALAALARGRGDISAAAAMGGYDRQLVCLAQGTAAAAMVARGMALLAVMAAQAPRRWRRHFLWQRQWAGAVGRRQSGFGNYGSVVADASATGGRGGDGAGGTTSGNGGNGGEAIGGGVNLLVRGSRVDVDTATLIANATGGDGGLGDGETSSDGNGGNATIGSNAGFGFITGIDILVTGRFNIPTQRGTLNAGAISGSAIATGGAGAANGNSASLGAGSVTFLNADGNIGSLACRSSRALHCPLNKPSRSSRNRPDDDGFFTTTGTCAFADNAVTPPIPLLAANFVASQISAP